MDLSKVKAEFNTRAEFSGCVYNVASIEEIGLKPNPPLPINIKRGTTMKKMMISFDEQTPKKHLTNAKHCVLCINMGHIHGLQYTEKDRTPKKDSMGAKFQIPIFRFLSNSC